MSEDRTWLKSFMEMHLEIQEALKAKNELDEIKLLLKELDVGQVPGYQPLSAIQGIRKLHGAWMQLSQCEVANVKTAVDFMQKNEALRAENAKLRAEVESLNRYFNVGVKLTGEKQALQLDVAELKDEVKGLRAENAKLRHENNLQDGAADAVIESLRSDIQDMRREYGALREEYANRGAIIQDFAKREHETQKLVGELEKQIGHMEQVIREFFPASVIPAPWERDVMTIPQGEWVLRSNEALRRMVADLERQCKVGELTAQNWKSIYERQIAVTARQRSRIAELRKQLQRITIERIGGTATMAQMAQMALDADDRSLDRPITQEAK